LVEKSSMCVGSFWSFLWAFAQGSCFHASIIKWNKFNNIHHLNGQAS